MKIPRQHAVFPVEHLETVKRQLLHWADRFSVAVYLDSNEYPQTRYGSWECLVAVEAADFFQAQAGRAFSDFRRFYEEKQDWRFGFFGYDLKNEVERLESAHPDGIGLPDLYFFQPNIVAGIRRSAPGSAFRLEIFSLTTAPREAFAQIREIDTTAEQPGNNPVSLRPRIAQADYLDIVEAIRRHIVDGDVYEMNLCQEFYAEQAFIDPLSTFERLNALTRAPFSAYLRRHEHRLLCASPERFLRKEGDTLISQPIKGTRRRHADPAEDARIREELRESIKDRAENVMIVDLVRNDLARHCLPGSVRVEELFGVYAFRTVHQMISTVLGTLRPATHPLEALCDAFPMGSMTGAPKVMAMALIEQYERTRRGLYSGALGYFDPDGDFDFNVVIRSILHRADTGYLSCQVGGAIVYDSDPAQEYEECLVKAGALLRALGVAAPRL